MPEHNTLTGSQLHEPKGAATATAGQVYVADGAGSGTWTTLNSAAVPGTLVQGVYDYNDLATASTPIPLTLADTQYEMTNDGAGAFTNKTYALPGVADLWDTATNRFDFTGLSLGDTVDIRFDFEVTTSSANTAIDFVIELGIGGSAYQLTFVPSSSDFKAAGTYKVVSWFGIYMGDSNTLDNPARILARSDNTGTSVKVNGWYMRPLHKIS